MKLKLPDQASKSQLKVRLQVPFLYKKISKLSITSKTLE